MKIAILLTFAIATAAMADITPRRLQKFTVSKGIEYKWSITRAEKALQSGKATADAQGALTIPAVTISDEPACLRIAPDRQTTRKGNNTMRIHWNQVIESYEFDTGKISGTLSPFGFYHGLSGLMHRNQPVNLVLPGKSFLNAEYYIRPGSARNKYVPRKISRAKKTTHELIDNSVVIHFPSEPEYAFALDLTYSFHEDSVDMNMTINPALDIRDFEIFFASYVCEALAETWVPLSGRDGSQKWTKLRNRVKAGTIFGVMREESSRGLIPAAYPGSPVEVQENPFHKPILAARDPNSGLALVFLCDPSATKYLAGEYHGLDTAHDWAFGTDLVAGRQFKARARLICRPFPDVARMQEEVGQLWREFEMESSR